MQRSEKEMLDLILAVAKDDERVRGVIMNGSRANPNAPKDIYQDYDIVYVVNELESFISNHKWIDIFGQRLMLQMPEAMRNPDGSGHFCYLMLFKDYNRIDLTLIPVSKPELISNDSQTIVLLDKDGILPQFPTPDDTDYRVKPPSELFFSSCCNNFWWCMQNVAKGIARDELPYAMLMLNNIVREELHDMLSWHIGIKTDFAVSSGKMGKYFKRYLEPQLYEMYCKTYSDTTHLWDAIMVMCNLFSQVATSTGKSLGYTYNEEDEKNMREYINWIK